MDVPAPVGGIVEEVLLKVGDTASQGTPVARVAVSADAAAPAEAAAPSAVSTAVSAEAASRPPGGPVADPPAPKATREGAGAAGDGDGPIYASPSVRRLARELGVDLTRVDGSGRKGRVLAEDVRAHADGGGAARAAAPAGAGGPGLDLLPWPKVDFEKFGPVERVPLSRIGKISAANLARNWVYIPHVTHNDEADVTDLEAFRKQLNAEQSDVKVTMVALLLKACAATLKEFPKFNASLDGDELVVKQYYHLGFAADTPNGLVVPVVRDVDKKGVLELAAELTELSGKARAGKLGPADMSGGTFTISSLGGIGGTSFTPIVNAPEVAILGVVRSAMKPVWDGSQFVPRLMLPLSLSYDHRVIDGAAAARFAAHLARVLSDLRRVIL
jgi:pyruvate dehydrogenase E2 component (dihydrolipoamide acetyltransferase)